MVEEEYWSKGIDTDAIPREILEDYLATDLGCTDSLFHHISGILPASKQSLFNLQCQDLLCLLEMEGNGIKFDWTGIAKAREETKEALTIVEKELFEKWIHSDEPISI